VERDQGVPVVAIARLNHLIAFVAGDVGSEGGVGPEDLQRLQGYRERYGVDY